MTKQQLKEKIKKGEYIWCCNIANGYEYDDFIERVEAHLNKDSQIKITKNDLIIDDIWFYSLKCLFSTKSDAEHYLEHGNITRAEKLPFIIWEEFKKSKHLFCRDINKNLVKMYINEDLNRIIIEKDSLEWFKFELTEENFYKAYDIARKLFLGEENEI